MNNIDLEREDQDIIKDVLDLCQDYGQQLTMDKLTLNYLYKQGEAVPEKSRLMKSRQITNDLSCNPISSNAIPLKCQLPIPKSHQVQTWINNGSQYKEASLRNTPSSEKFRMYTRPPTPDSGVSDVSPVSSPVCTPTSSSCINPLQTSQSKNDVHRYRPMPAFIDKNKHVLMNETHRRTFKSVPIFDQQIQRTQGSNYDTQILDGSCSMYSYEPIPRKPWSDCIHKQELLETEFGQCKHARSWGKGQVRYRGEFSPLDDEYEAKIQRYEDLTKFIIEPSSSKIYKDVSKHERAVQRQTMGMEEAFIMFHRQELKTESGRKKRTRSQKKRPDDDSVPKSQRREKQIEIPHCKAETFSSQPKKELGFSSPPNEEVLVGFSSPPNEEVGFSSPPNEEVGFSSPPNEEVLVGFSSPPNEVGFSSPPNEEVGFSRPPNEEVAASSPEMATQSQVLPILIKDPMLPSESVMRKNYASGIFDHSGGHLLLMEMKVKLFIPPGAIPKDVEQEIFIYVSWENQHQLKCPKPKTSAGPIIICGPNGLKFRERVCLTFNHCFESAGEKWKLSPVYTATDIDKPSNYQPLIDPNKELSEQTSTCLLDVCNGKQRVTILVSHFTGFGLMAEPVQLNALSIADAEMDPAPPNVQGLGVAGARIDPVNPNGLGPGEAKAKMDLVLPNGEGACVAETDMDLAPSNGPITVHVGLDKQWMYTMVYLSMQTDIQLRVYVVKQIPGAEQWVEHEERKLSNPGMKCDATKQLAFYPNKKGIMVNLVNFETGWELYPSQEDPQRVLPYECLWERGQSNCTYTMKTNGTKATFRCKISLFQLDSSVENIDFHISQDCKYDIPNVPVANKVMEASIPFTARLEISHYLDYEHPLGNDWRKFAEWNDLNMVEINKIESMRNHKSPTFEVFTIWEGRKFAVTVEDLISLYDFFLSIERNDVARVLKELTESKHGCIDKLKAKLPRSPADSGYGTPYPLTPTAKKVRTDSILNI